MKKRILKYSLPFLMLFIFLFTGCTETMENQSEETQKKMIQNDKTDTASLNDPDLQGRPLIFKELNTEGLWKKTEMTMEHFDNADIMFMQDYQPYVQIIFNEEGTKIFADITERNIGKQLAIYIGDELITAPLINEKITNGKAIISGDFTVTEALSLAKELMLAKLPPPPMF